MAAQTPAERNRYVDFLRFISILAVIVGHWLIATAYMVDGEMNLGHLLKDSTEFHWLTWLFQVMPIFFIVGGYSNAVSLESAKRKGIDYAGWLSARLNRLVAPLLVLLISWGVIAVLLAYAGVTPENVKMLSRAALIPTWFLAIYIMIVMLAPAAYKFWQRFGFASFWAFVVAAVLTDVVFFNIDNDWYGFANYFFVWLAVHHLGFAWRDGRMGGTIQLLSYAAVGFVSLWLLVTYGPYPLAMVGSPDVVSNSAPPKVSLIALGVFQFGLLLSLENPMRRALNGLRLWTATVLINSMIMTVYLWHMTLMIVFVSLLYIAGGPGLGIEPATTGWWLTRPIWIGVLLVLLLPVALLMSPLERRSRSADAAVPAAAQQIAGAVMLCFGITMLVMIGYDGTPTTRLDLAAIVMVIVGAGISGLLPRFR
jgi:Acyltransferase family